MRRRRAPKRDSKVDSKYSSPIIEHFINMVMKDGRKSIAQQIVYGSFSVVEARLKEDGVKAFFTALENARPRLAVKPRRIGGATYQVPVELPKEKGIAIALKWMRDFARSKKGKSMGEKLAEEIISAYKYEGSVIKKKEDTHKMAEANRAFAHFKW